MLSVKIQMLAGKELKICAGVNSEISMTLASVYMFINVLEGQQRCCIGFWQLQHHA